MPTKHQLNTFLPKSLPATSEARWGIPEAMKKFIVTEFIPEGMSIVKDFLVSPTIQALADDQEIPFASFDNYLRDNFDLSYAEIRASLHSTNKCKELESVLWPLTAVEPEPSPLRAGGSGGAASGSDQTTHDALQAQGIFAERLVERAVTQDLWLNKLRGININKEVLNQLKSHHAIQDYGNLYKNLMRYRASAKGNHAFYASLSDMQAWEFCILSGELRAIQIAERFFDLRWDMLNRELNDRGKLGDPLHYAAVSGNLQVFRKALLKYELEYRTRRGENPLHHHEAYFNNLLHDMAALSGNIELLQKCLSLFGALIDPKSENLHEMSPDNYHLAHYAALSGNPDMMNYVVSLGINPFQHSQHKVTVLHCAAESGKIEAIELALAWLKEPENYISPRLLKRFFPSDDLSSLTPLQKTRGRKDLLAEYRWKHDQPYKTLTADGKNILHYAARGGALPALRQAVALGIDLNLKDNLGRLPVFDATYSAEPESVYFFIEQGLDFAEVKDDGGYTLLHAAAWWGLSDMAYELIVKYGLDPSQKNNEEEDAYAVARRGWGIGTTIDSISRAHVMQRKAPLLPLRHFLLY